MPLSGDKASVMECQNFGFDKAQAGQKLSGGGACGVGKPGSIVIHDLQQLSQQLALEG